MRFGRKKGAAIVPAKGTFGKRNLKKANLEKGQKEVKGESQKADVQQPVLRREGASLVSASVKELKTDEESLYSDEGKDHAKPELNREGMTCDRCAF